MQPWRKLATLKNFSYFKKFQPWEISETLLSYATVAKLHHDFQISGKLHILVLEQSSAIKQDLTN